MKKATRSLFIVGTLIGGLVMVRMGSAMTFQDTVDVQFTFGEALSLSLSSSDIVIENLVPGTYDKSNTISVNVDTNNAHGYTLSAKVGGTGETDDSSDLVNTTVNSSFTSIGTDASLTLANFSSGTWGYTTASSINNNTTYSGLPYGNYKTLNITEDHSGTAFGSYPGGVSTKFTIGASSDSAQLAGVYSNVITFTVVGNVTAPPVCNPSGRTIWDINCMQDIGSANGYTVFNSMEVDKQYRLYDSRDQKEYYVAKLADGNVWMTQNLDHDIVSTTNFYTYDNTDIGHGSTPNTSATWTGTATRITSDTTWSSSVTAPESYDPGNLCWDGVITTENGNLSNRTTTCSDSNMHYHIGNYYNWTAAVAMTNSDSYTADNTDVDQSICPAGWMLPKGGTVQTGSGSFYYLVNQLSLTSGTSGNVQNTPVFFPYGGYWLGSSSNVGSLSYYWSSVAKNGGFSYLLYFNGPGVLSPQSDAIRAYGSFARCVARPQSISINSLTYMQDFANLTSSEKTSVLNSMTTGTSYTLLDSRDNAEYKIAKLVDGNVWMRDNLALDIGETAMTSSDTNASAITLMCFEIGSCGSSYADDEVEEVTTFDSYTVPQYNAQYKDTTATSYGDTSGKLGVYYNYCAASAGSYCYAEGSGTGDASEDICPAGWQLPTSGINSNLDLGKYPSLFIAYDQNVTNYLNGFGAVLSGWFGETAPDLSENDAYWWSSSNSGGSNMFEGYAGGGVSMMDFMGGSERFMGDAVRCILK